MVQMLRQVMVILFLVCQYTTNAQSIADTTTERAKKVRTVGFPVVFYLPETRFAVGGAAMFTFATAPQDSSRKSSVRIGAAYTQNKQLLLFCPFNLYFSNNRHNISGEIGYYKYNYYFYGTGMPALQNQRELYGVKFPRVKLTALTSIYRRILYLGLRGGLDDWRLYDLDLTGKLAQGIITGSNGGLTSHLGGILILDNRDHIFYPTTGWFIELSSQTDSKLTASDFRFSRYTIDVAKYFAVRSRFVVALNYYSVHIQGAAPFNQLAQLGGAKKLRGFYEGQFRDKQLILAQLELRARVFRRFGAAAFYSVGQVAPAMRLMNTANFVHAGGAGVRVVLDQKENINLRFDVAVGRRQPQFYFTLTEAF